MGAAKVDDGRKRARWTRAAVAFSACGVLGFLAFVFVVAASVFPTDTTKLSGQHPAIEDRSARVAKAGCGLAETKSPDGSCAPLPPVASVHDEQVTFPSSIPEKGLPALHGTLTLPDGVGPRGAIVLLHGSGPNSRDEVVPGDLVSKVDPPFAVFKALAEFFAHEGLVVLRYDKRNCLRCYPDFDLSRLDDFRWSDLERDARDALAYLRTRPEVDANALVVAGHSEGGQIAPYVAVGEEGVVAVMMLAGLTETFDEALLAQYDRFHDIRLGQGDLLGALNISIARRAFATCFAKLSGAHDPKDRCMGGGVTLEMLADFLAYEKRMPEVLKSETCPVFAVQGSVDRNIDPEEMGKLAVLLAGKDHELHYVPKASHLLVDAVDAKSPPELDPDVKRRMHAFLGSVKR